jgi:membrane protein required for colicin V production
MIIDSIYLICLLIFLVRGYSKGIVIALFSVVAIIFGVLAALKLSGTVSKMLFSSGNGAAQWAPLVTYALIFLLVVWLVRLGARLIEKSFEAVALGWINKLAGAALYGFLISFVFSSLLWLLDKMQLINAETKAASKVYPLLDTLAPMVFSGIGNILPFAKHIFDDLSGFFDGVNQTLPDYVDPDR